MKAAHYYIAQYISDLFRNEPKNIGVFVELMGEFNAKFIGETEHGDIDGRKLRVFDYPDVYRQWVDYWHKLAKDARSELLITTSGSHFRVIEGGEITNFEGDTLHEITENLYSLLVSDGGYYEASGEAEEIFSLQVTLDNELNNFFKENNLLNEKEVLHPIKRNIPVAGTHTLHKPSFIQENGALYIMETIDFTTIQKSRSRDHAGLSAYMFRDIKDKSKKVEPISIIKLNSEDLQIEEVQYGLSLLKNESSIVNWLVENERNEFLDNCKKTAYSK